MLQSLRRDILSRRNLRYNKGTSITPTRTFKIVYMTLKKILPIYHSNIGFRHRCPSKLEILLGFNMYYNTSLDVILTAQAIDVGASGVDLAT